MKTNDNDKFDGDVAVDENIDKFCDRMYVAGIKSINNDAITIDDTMMLLYMTTMINMMVMVIIPHICHFFYTGRIFKNQILHPKNRHYRHQKH